MNYLAHGIRFLDRPYFLIGSAIPDMLNVVNRKSRVRKRTIEEHLPDLSGNDRELALGMLQHLHDDQWFHGTPGFYATTAELSALFRRTLGPDDDWNCGFLGHIVTELLMDATLCEDRPGVLNEYYNACSRIDPHRVEELVTRVATQPPLELSRFLGLFVEERFLADYADNDRLLYRLNQVMKRVGTRQLPPESISVLQKGREVVRDGMSDLLPPEHFNTNSTTW